MLDNKGKKGATPVATPEEKTTVANYFKKTYNITLK